MVNVEDSLQKLGLTKNEITIYEYLLKKGLSAGSEIHKDNSMDKSSAYEALSHLQKKGLIYVIGKSRNQKFDSVSPEKLYELLSEREEEFSKVKKDINNFITNFEEISKENYRNKNIRIIEGKEGFKKWAWARLEIPKGSIIRDVSTDELQQSFTNSPKEYKQYSIDMPLRRAEKGIYMHGFMKKSDIEKSIVPKSINKSDPKFLKEIRVIPEEIQIPCSLVTFGDNTSFLRKKDGDFFGLIINDKLITSLVNNILDYIWNHSTLI